MLAGHNACIYAFGQTNSGKTWTMCGTERDPGIIPRAARDVFSRIQYLDVGTVGLLRVSLIELYNETFRDLLYDIPCYAFRPNESYDEDGAENHPVMLSIVEDPTRGPILAHAREVIVRTVDDVLRLIAIGEHRRSVAQNDAHMHASRSHLIFEFIFEAQCSKTKQTRVSTLRVVDMAGSETPVNLTSDDTQSIMESRAESLDMAHRVKTDAQKRECAARRYEGANIRKSLLAVVRCIDIVQQNQHDVHRGQQHVPYRDSKLTRLLCETLGGSTETAIVCTMNPNEQRESLATLRFALHAQRIRTYPRVVHALHGTALLQRFTAEMEALKEDAKWVEQRRAKAEAARDARHRAKLAEEARIERRFAAIEGFLLTNAQEAARTKAERCRSLSPRPEVLEAIAKQNEPVANSFLTDAFLKEAKEKIPVELQKSIAEKEKELDKLLMQVKEGLTTQAKERAGLESQSQTLRNAKTSQKALEGEVDNLKLEVQKRRDELNSHIEKFKTDNAYYFTKCAKYITRLDKKQRGSRWDRFKETFYSFFHANGKVPHVDIETVRQLKRQLDALGRPT